MAASLLQSMMFSLRVFRGLLSSSSARSSLPRYFPIWVAPSVPSRLSTTSPSEIVPRRPSVAGARRRCLRLASQFSVRLGAQTGIRTCILRSQEELIMKRSIAMALSILAVAGVVGWKLASHPETSAGLQDVSLVQSSEHSHPGPTGALAGIRIRLSPSDYDDALPGDGAGRVLRRSRSLTESDPRSVEALCWERCHGKPETPAPGGSVRLPPGARRHRGRSFHVSLATRACGRKRTSSL